MQRRPNRDPRRPNRDAPRPNREAPRPNRESPRPERPDRARPPAGDDAVSAQRGGQRPPQRGPGPRPLAPTVPDDVTADQLDPDIRRELRGLPESLADTVAKHLIAAGRFLEEEPERARAHAGYARAVASRIPAVREAAGITAYLVGDYADALAELRAARRMTGRPDHLAIMADCERGLGRPERALALARDPAAKDLDAAGKVELRIVESGARRDLGEFAAAVVSLQIPELHARSADAWTVRLWYAYADALLAAGRRDEAREWFAATAEIDDLEETDAAERLAGFEDEPA